MIDLNQLNTALTEYDEATSHASEIKVAMSLLKEHKATVAALGMCYDDAFQVAMQKVQKVQSYGVSIKQAYELVKELRAA